MSPIGVSMASIGVTMPQRVQHGLCWCGMASVGVARPKWVWHGVSGFAWFQSVWQKLSGCGMSSV